MQSVELRLDESCLSENFLQARLGPKTAWCASKSDSTDAVVGYTQTNADEFKRWHQCFGAVKAPSQGGILLGLGEERGNKSREACQAFRDANGERNAR